MTDTITAIAALPMYDWPELEEAHETYWQALRKSLTNYDFPAPQAMHRGTPDGELWQQRGLLLSQTCGLPLVRGLDKFVDVIGTPAYDINCGAGYYYSVIVVRQDYPAANLAELQGSRFTCNGDNSQSGYATLAYALRDLAGSEPYFISRVQSGSHRQSIRNVAAGVADVAAIDAVTWGIALRHEDAAQELRILTTTEPTPGLPMICSKNRGWSTDRLHMAVVEAMATLDETTREMLLLSGFAQTSLEDYALIRQRLEIVKSVSM